MAEALNPLGWFLLGVCLAFSFSTSVVKGLLADEPMYRETPARQLLRRELVAPFLLLAVLLGLGFWSFCTAQGDVTGVLTILVALGLAERIERSQWPDGMVVDLGRYFPTGAALATWLVVYLLLGSSPEQDRQRCAWEAACGTIGTSYLLAGVTKVHEAGWRWTRWSNVGLLLIERSTTGAPWQRRLRRWLAGKPRLVVAGANFALWGELLGPLLWFEETRWLYVGLATALQLSIFVTLGYLEIEWILVVPAVVLLAATAGGAG